MTENGIKQKLVQNCKTTRIAWISYLMQISVLLAAIGIAVITG